MGFWRTTGKVIGHVVDVRVDRWCDLTWLKSSTQFFVNCVKILLTSEKPQYSETFEEAVQRLDLTSAHLAQQARSYFLLSMFFVFLTISLLVYTILIAYLKNWMGVCISIALMIYAATLAFRHYFWYFQIREQKLGCKMSDWYQIISSTKKAKL